MPTQLLLVRDQAGENTFGIKPPDTIKNTTLSAGVEQNFTVPTTANVWLAVFSPEKGSDVFVAVNDTAALPGSSFADSTSFQNPGSWQVNSGNTISMITNDTTVFVSVAFYAIS